jgi:hypothetical protein
LINFTSVVLASNNDRHGGTAVKYLILLAGLALLVAYWMGRRARTACTQDPAELQELGRKRRQWLLQVLVAVAVIGGGWGYLDWTDGQRIVVVRVVDGRTGVATSYEARKSEVSFRSFMTTDGRRVILSDVERMEVNPMEGKL